MARWIDMTDAQKGALHMKEEAKRRAKILANPAYILRDLAEIDAIAAAELAEGGKYAQVRHDRALEEKQPIFAMLARLNINPADIGIAA